MQCRLIEATVFGDGMESAFESVRTNVVPRVKELPGFRGAYWLADRDSGKFYAATFFDSLESLDASREQAKQIRDDGMQAENVRFDAVKEFEVIANTGDKVSTTATHARVTRTETDPNRFDYAAGAIKSTVIPEAQEMKGFQGGFWLADRQSGEGFGATLWDSADALHATSAPSADLRRRVTDDIGSQVTNVHDLEVVVRAETPG